MNKITNMDQLQSEIKRLRDQAKLQEAQLRNDYEDLREELKPRNILWNALSSLTGIKLQGNDFFNTGIAGLLRRFVLRSERKIENKFYDVVDGLFDKIKHFVNKFSGAEARREERSDERENRDGE